MTHMDFNITDQQLIAPGLNKRKEPPREALDKNAP
jgi:hypothetical protein